MSTYTLASEETKALLTDVREKFHARLDDEDVRIGVLMAFATTDEDTGEKRGHAIRGYAGAPAGAQVKKVPTKDRLTKGYDVELLIDGDEWPKMDDAHRRALLDHELTHIELTSKVDDLGRPKIKLRPEDFIAWGFWEIIQRHGKAAMEHRALTILAEKHGQLLLGLDIAAEAKMTGIESVTFTPTGSEKSFKREVGEFVKGLCDEKGIEFQADVSLSSMGRKINACLNKQAPQKD